MIIARANRKKYKRRGRRQYAKGNKEKSIVDFYLAKYHEFSICYGLAV